MSGNSLMPKKAIFIADSLDNAYRFQQVLSKMDVDVVAGSTSHLRSLASANSGADLVIYEMRSGGMSAVAEAEQMLVEEGIGSILLIVPEEDLADLRLPVRLKADFVTQGASLDECSARIRLLLWPGKESSSNDFITVDNMSINLATYQVKINGEPIDLTYLEYALLTFLVIHPGHTYSRDTLLRRVWGFDYYGGSRTVDVHVRRVRAKLGPELAQHLETVRGVGYLWNV